jgi:L-asparaginase
VLILNCGGTFNNRYNHLTGESEIPYDNEDIEKILKSAYFDYGLAGVIYKNSLDMDINDRKMLASIIMESKDDTFIIVHGTDSMSITAEFLSEIFEDRKIILTGSFKPFEIDNIEASLNLGLAIGFAKSELKNGVYICMSGYIEPWPYLVKNKALGKFELVR